MSRPIRTVVAAAAIAACFAMPGGIARAQQDDLPELTDEPPVELESPTPSPSPSPTATPSPEPTPEDEPEEGDETAAGSLPATGGEPGILALIGLGLLSGGIGLRLRLQ